MNEEKTNNDWNISFDGGFFENHSTKRGGKEIRINKSIPWGEETVHIPSVYIYSKGLIMDLLIETDSQKVWDYINKYDLLNDEYAEKLTKEQREKLENESPLLFDINTTLILNGKKLRKKGGSGCSWIPNMPEEMQPRDKAIEVLEYYGMDMTKAWSIRRIKFLWATVTKPKIGNLDLTIGQDKIPLTAGYFENTNVGDEVEVRNPADESEYTIKIEEIKRESLKSNHFPNNAYDYPNNLTEMIYTISPEIEANKFRILDCIENEQPRLNPNKSSKPQENSAVSIGIIGGSDGPTSIIVSSSKKPQNTRAAISALHFDEEYTVKWRMIFYTKTREDLNIKLI